MRPPTSAKSDSSARCELTPTHSNWSPSNDSPIPADISTTPLGTDPHPRLAAPSPVDERAAGAVADGGDEDEDDVMFIGGCVEERPRS